MAEGDRLSDEDQKVLDLMLFDAVEATSYDRVRMAVKKGANINARRPEDLRTPLMCAAWSEKATMVQVLLQQGADIYLKAKDGRTAYDLVRTANNGTIKAQMTDFILSSLPDRRYAPPGEEAPKRAVNDDLTETKQDITVGKPVTLQAPKAGGKGFSL
jgi:ankyrin repeat protein